MIAFNNFWRSQYSMENLKISSVVKKVLIEIMIRKGKNEINFVTIFDFSRVAIA